MVSNTSFDFSLDDEWYTPKYIFNYFGPFDYDPCTTKEKANEFGLTHFDTIESDGLKSDWSKYHRIWINPPFSQKKEFLTKAFEHMRLYPEDHICFVCPISWLSTSEFHSVINGFGCYLYLFNGRIKFEKIGRSNSSPAFASVVLILSGIFEGIVVIRDNLKEIELWTKKNGLF